MIVIKNKRAVKRFRKMLRAKLRQGVGSLRVFGSRGSWHLGIQLGSTIYRYSDPEKASITMTSAILVGYRKFHIKATQYKGRAVA